MLRQYDELVQEVLGDIFVITRSEDEKLNKVIKKYFSAGGKRVRVLLLLICSKLALLKLSIRLVLFMMI